MNDCSECCAGQIDLIQTVLKEYFDGLHYGDTAKLDRIFDEAVVLMSLGVRRTKSEWLSLVESRKVPHGEGYPYHYEVISIEVNGPQAMAKVYCPFLSNHFLDYLGLLKENDQWKIVSKMYADYPGPVRNSLLTNQNEG